MTIEIHEPRLEELIENLMRSGRFESVEEVLIDAMESFVPPRDGRVAVSSKPNLADFLLQSPLRDSGLAVDRIHDEPREFDL